MISAIFTLFFVFGLLWCAFSILVALVQLLTGTYEGGGWSITKLLVGWAILYIIWLVFNGTFNYFF